MRAVVVRRAARAGLGGGGYCAHVLSFLAPRARGSTRRFALGVTWGLLRHRALLALGCPRRYCRVVLAPLPLGCPRARALSSCGATRSVAR